MWGTSLSVIKVPLLQRVEVAMHISLPLVKSNKLFSRCSSGFTANLSVLLREISMMSDEVIFRANEVCNELYLISSSSVNLMSLGPDGMEMVGYTIDCLCCAMRKACTELTVLGSSGPSCKNQRNDGRGTVLLFQIETYVRHLNLPTVSEYPQPTPIHQPTLCRYSATVGKAVRICPSLLLLPKCCFRVVSFVLEC